MALRNWLPRGSGQWVAIATLVALVLALVAYFVFRKKGGEDEDEENDVDEENDLEAQLKALEKELSTGGKLSTAAVTGGATESKNRTAGTKPKTPPPFVTGKKPPPFVTAKPKPRVVITKPKPRVVITKPKRG